MKTGLAYIILFITLIFLPELSHASLPEGGNGQKYPGHNNLLCLDCHSYIRNDSNHPSFGDSNASCLECHENSYEFQEGGKLKVKCLDCHSRHAENVSNDAHSGVPCEACHLYALKPIKKMRNNIPVWGFEKEGTGEYDPHRLITNKAEICSRCHYRGNNLGAPDNVLPAKSIICMPCHAATFTLKDIPSVIALVIFLIGISGILVLWLAAGKGYRKNGKHESHVITGILAALILDGLFQRKLLKVSVKRWIIHGMILFPFMIRFGWGILALVSSLTFPEWKETWVMLDKNNPVTAFVFDITGFLILAGGCLMFLNKRSDRKKLGIKGLPVNSMLVQILLAAGIITGFIVEGARISMTGSPEGSQYAFIGYGISRLLLSYHLNGIYAYLWYVHAVITAAFIACLPYSRMVHILFALLSLGIKASSGE